MKSPQLKLALITELADCLRAIVLCSCCISFYVLAANSAAQLPEDNGEEITLDRCEVVRMSVANLLVPLDEGVELEPEKREQLKSLVERTCKKFGDKCELSFCRAKPTPTPAPTTSPLVESETLEEPQNPFDRFHEYAEFKLKVKRERMQEEKAAEEKSGKVWRPFSVPE